MYEWPRKKPNFVLTCCPLSPLLKTMQPSNCNHIVIRINEYPNPGPSRRRRRWLWIRLKLSGMGSATVRAPCLWRGHTAAATQRWDPQGMDLTIRGCNNATQKDMKKNTEKAQILRKLKIQKKSRKNAVVSPLLPSC